MADSNEQETSATDGRQAEAASAAAAVEAILFASDTPLPAAKIAQVTGLAGQGAVRQAVELLNSRYAQAGSSFRIEAIAGGYQMLTLPEHHEALSRLLQSRKDTHLSKPALETLAIVAYRQPILRADIEAIRGVACGEVLRGLIEKQLVKIVGRAEVLGRPMLYGTTRRFLELFGLSSTDDLPRAEELRTALAEKTAAAKAPDAQGPDDTESAEAEDQLDQPEQEEAQEADPPAE